MHASKQRSRLKRYRRMIYCTTIAVLIAALTGCTGNVDDRKDGAGDGDGRKKRIELIVSAAASLQDSLNAIEPLYEEHNRSIDLIMNYGSSGALQKQIEQGAPADLFLSAGVRQIESLASADLVRDTVDLLSNQLVAIVPEEAALSIANLQDLPAAGLRTIAIGDPDVVPAGGYAREALISAGMWQELESKLVLAKDVRQVTTYVETGNAELGFVYKTDALSSDRAIVAFEVAPELHAPILYPAGVVTRSKHRQEAERFLAYLRGDAASAVFESQGFRTLAEESN
jgi:molybdate transport system substrate-binding protein